MTPSPRNSSDPGGALHADIGWALRALSIAFRTHATAAVEDLPGGPRGYLLLAAAAGGEEQSQLALAQRLSIDKTQVTYLLDALQGQGLVERVPGPTDRRVKLVRLTDRGQVVLVAARRTIADAEGRALGALSGEEQATLRELLVRAADGLTQTSTDQAATR